MPHTTSSVFPTAPPANGWCDAVASGLVTSPAVAWLAIIGQPRPVQLGWVLGTSWCWRGSGSIERACMCIAQHCLDRELGCGRGGTFLCRPVPPCWTPFILAICSERFSAHEGDCLSRADAGPYTIDGSSTISSTGENPRGLGSTKCLARRSTRRSVRFDPWRSTTIQLAATVVTSGCTSSRGIQCVDWTAREQRRGNRNFWGLGNPWGLCAAKRGFTKL